MTGRTFIDALKEFSVVIALIILLPMTVHYGATLIHPYPQGSSAVVLQGKYLSEELLQEKITDKQYASPAALKNLQSKLQTVKAFKQDVKQYYRALFYTCLIFGILFILTGLLISVRLIDTGFIIGGAFMIIDGYLNYWSRLENWMQFLSLLVAVVLVVVTAYFKLVRRRA
ncbi:MAG: hypothetical protein A3I77_05860 [Gammaproteobacteria bacterium RIFCSPLOWO2_02_FULL_42_14]|nr:MAG: hypothetical protein A3B71_02130 [Gammaproteobacteria bacterium RIFCSPHIGHO2_02_FULL_42_43]OGT27641.1 MAG: hypothetical protein A2624_00275 [Gammaproteobacteria bacterium RIFCSPHIGHO2_01_FULL_42_8]OGT53381.1 MAG: hypothetical protein A3E54_06645 [Gammaproteobacteria bacterium RIFCSPHIGHO2_12_FULL_41_25]OGT63423.1 MAG: hypothetical protein A3I77_05860 [Gammaproteobacteria bacterium RIFCSPLOWO2_02_FULL_42_14]OGT87349.1 MAG: hypothetical protein A3G86_00305 [Gammaproteobacteria bacterium R